MVFRTYLLWRPIKSSRTILLSPVYFEVVMIKLAICRTPTNYTKPSRPSESRREPVSSQVPIKELKREMLFYHSFLWIRYDTMLKYDLKLLSLKRALKRMFFSSFCHLIIVMNVQLSILNSSIYFRCGQVKKFLTRYFLQQCIWVLALL